MIFDFVPLARTKDRLRANVRPCPGSSDEIEEHGLKYFPNPHGRLFEITLLPKNRRHSKAILRRNSLEIQNKSWGELQTMLYRYEATPRLPAATPVQ
jgi:hypothetical protein